MISLSGLRPALARAAIYVWGACTGLAAAQAYPAKPIQLIVPFSAGGDADMAARNRPPRRRGCWGSPWSWSTRRAPTARSARPP